MSETEETTDQKVDRVADEMMKLKHLVHMFLKVKNGKHEDFIVDEVRKRRRAGISVAELKRMTGWSRTWCLEMMGRIPLTNPQIKFIKGDKHQQRGSRLIWLEEADLKIYNTIKELVDKEEVITFRRLIDLFKIERTTAKNVADAFCDANEDYMTYSDESRNHGRWSFEDCNIIRKKTINKESNSE